ncbi:outer membrane beta-barrel family protein [Galbibacter sp.]|uniref:outer membrane beta-barrel family protein n=1 Tax=Galbibacter sp. TaxID=2918471 RepID=UPI002D150534|nr:outer membrane beta-barrel family protein [Galbibacter sp.]HLV62996.1 outer membrane beta-barrel family protein [Galbibacter sp.]
MSHLKKILLILILSVGYFSNAQEIRISGRVIDQQENPIYFANIVLLNPNDSILVQGTSTNEDGTFALESLHSGNYILQASYIGYILYSTSLNITTDTELSDIVLKVDTQELQAVEVTKDLPVLEKKAGKLVFHVANTSLSSLSSYEILQQTPGVLTMGDVISIKNSKTTVYINNRRVYLDDSELKSFLQSYAGSNVSDIEIILNPSSKYDADSGYIINIQTNKNVSVGYKGSLEGTYKQGVYSKYGLGTNHYYKSNFLDIYAGYNINQQKWYKEDQGYIQFYQAQQLDDYWEWDMYKTSKYTSHHLNTIFDFTLDDSNFLSLSTNVSFQPNHHVDNQVQTRNYTSTRDYIGGNNALGVLENDNTNIAVNATYTKEINDRNSLSLQTNYVYYHDTSTQGLNTSFFDANEELSQENFLETDGDQQNTIFTAQGDYSMEMQTESLLDFGVKFARISSKSEMLYIGSYVPINASDDHFKYQENNLSLYVNYSKDWDTWSFQTGVRGESTSISGVSQALGEINGQDYFELFPNIGLQHQLSENHLLGIYYKRGINRPRYQSLNPYRYYINEYNFISGNPNLTRSIENRVGLEYTYSDNFIFDLYYQNIKGDLNRFSFQDNENKFLYNAYFNAEEFYQYSLDFTYYSYITKNWFVSLYSSAYYYNIGFEAIESDPEVVNLDTFGFFGQLNNWVTLSKDRTWRATVNLEYLTGFYFGNYYLNNRFKTSVGLRKLIWEGRGEFNMNLADVFNSVNVPLKIDYLNQNNWYSARPETRVLTLSFKYKFGNYNLKDNQRDLEIKEQQRLEEEAEL